VGWPDKRRSNRVVLDFFVSFFIKKKRKEKKGSIDNTYARKWWDYENNKEKAWYLCGRLS
jgi:hypothetical protein